MRHILLVASLMLGLATPASAQVSIGIGFPGVSIGINVPIFPQLERVPGYPVYYAPALQSNFFFYDGVYWVYQDDNWYASDWYNGPWGLVGPEAVPLFVLRIPVRYYRSPPSYFRGWQPEAPPRWGDHWGDSWQQRRPGWDRWNRNAAPPPAPLPTYQRRYPAERYPQPDRQQELHNQNYRYQPRDAAVRQHFRTPAPEPVRAPQQRAQPPAETPHAAPPAPRQQVPATPGREQRQQVQPAPAAREQAVPEPRQREAQRGNTPPRESSAQPAKGREAPHDNVAPHAQQQRQGQGQGQNRDRENDDERGPDRKK